MSSPFPPLLQISDTHFGTENPPVVQALLVLARQLAPAPVLAIPGNHDIPLLDLARRAADPYARHREAFGPVLEPTHISPAWRVVGVKTTRRWRHRHGQVSPQQIQAVARPQDAIHLLRGGQAAVQRWVQAGAATHTLALQR